MLYIENYFIFVIKLNIVFADYNKYKRYRVKEKYVNFLKNKYPCTKLFRYNNDYLIYDAKPNFAFILSEVELEFLIDFLSCNYQDNAIINIYKNRIPDSENLLLKIHELVSQGVFVKGSVDEISPINLNIINNQIKYFENNIVLRKFCLELTEDCNLRCKYCPNTIEKKNRKHSNLYMSEEIACKAIDYYFNSYIKIFSKLPDEKKQKVLEFAPPSLSWYGGEPLLNFKVLMSSYNYFLNKSWKDYFINDKCFTFSLTSNLFTINDNIIKFLIDNNIKLTVSLDGNKSEHNKNRVDKYGNGTFDIVYKNLLKIKKISKEYYSTNLKISSVEADNNNIKICRDFTDSLGIKNIFRTVSNYKGIFIPKVIFQDANSNKDRDIEIEKFIDKIKILPIDISETLTFDVLKPLLDFDYINFNEPNGSNLLNTYMTCPMGFDNLMVGADGRFHICHKTDGSYSIGDVSVGVCKKTISKMFYSYNTAINNENCKNCWMIRFCKFCSAERLIDGKFFNPSNYSGQSIPLIPEQSSPLNQRTILA